MEGSSGRDDLERSSGHPARGRVPHDQSFDVDEEQGGSLERGSRFLRAYSLASIALALLILLVIAAAIVAFVI